MSPFFVLCLFLLLSAVALEKFLASKPQERRSSSRSTYGIPVFRPVGLARSVALRSPQGEALRAKCRARPTTNAARWRPTWKLASAPSGGAVHATDGLLAASTSVSLPKSAHVGTPCGLVPREPAAALARQFPASATRAHRTRWSSCRTVPRIPTLCPARAHRGVSCAKTLYLNDQATAFLIVHWKHTVNLVRLVDVIPGDRTQSVRSESL